VIGYGQLDIIVCLSICNAVFCGA